MLTLSTPHLLALLGVSAGWGATVGWWLAARAADRRLLDLAAGLPAGEDGPPFIDYAEAFGLADEEDVDDWSMDLSDYHPTDPLLDASRMSDPYVTLLDHEGEAVEYPVAHEPPADERGGDR